MRRRKHSCTGAAPACGQSTVAASSSPVPAARTAPHCPGSGVGPRVVALRRLSAPPPAAGARPAWLPRVQLDTGLTSSRGCGHASGSPRPEGWTCRPAVTKRGSWRTEPPVPQHSLARALGGGDGGESRDSPFGSYTPWTRAPAALGSGESAASHSPALQPPTSSEPPRN